MSVIKIKALNAETGEFKEKILTLESDKQKDCLIGRHPSCDLVLDSAEVSRIHGRIWFQDGQCFYADLASTDGSQINEQDVQVKQVYQLKQYDLLRVGGFVLTIAQLPNEDILSPKSLRLEQLATISSHPRQWCSGDLNARCIEAIAETHDVKTFRFVAEPSVQFAYKPGQFVTLDLNIDGKQVLRSYSISSTPSRPHVLEITVKRVMPPLDGADTPPGLVSNWLHDHITVGSHIKMTGPHGQFTCVDHAAQKLLLISAGSGITPMMSMSRWLCDTGAEVDLVFIHSARSPRDLVFKHELESMAARHRNFKLAVTITRTEAGYAWHGYHGRLNETMLAAIASDLQERTAYVCGPTAFMEGIKTILQSLDFPMEHYYEESFGTPKRQPTVQEKPEAENTDVAEQEANTPQEDTCSDLNQFREYHLGMVSDQEDDTSVRVSADQASNEPTVVFAKQDRAIAADEEDTVLEIAEQKGIEIPFGCRMGACGTCKLPLLEGQVCYENDPACEPGYLLSCIAKPVGRIVVDA